MYRKFRNVPIFKDFPPICPYFLGFKVGKFELVNICREGIRGWAEKVHMLTMMQWSNLTMFMFQHSLPCGPHTSSSGVASTWITVV